MQQIVLHVQDASKVKYAASMAKDLTEKWAGHETRVTLFTEGGPASHSLLDEKEKLADITRGGGEVIACVPDPADTEKLLSMSHVITECRTDLQRREREGAEFLEV